MNKWTLEIGEFGKIKNAAIEVSPFMIFVGDNNSGKSYVMELLWAIIARTGDIIDNMQNDEDYQQLLSGEIPKATKVAIPIEIQEKLLDCFNKAFEKNQEHFIRKIYNHPIHAKGFKITRNDYFDLSFKVDNHFDEITDIVQMDTEQPGGWHFTNIQISHEDKVIIRVKIRSIEADSVDTKRILDIVYSRVIAFLIRKDFYNLYSSKAGGGLAFEKEPLYLPASRTGFMHTYRAIIGNQRTSSLEIEIEIDDTHDQNHHQIAGTNLTLPTILFLEKLQKLNISAEQVKKYEKQLQFLSESVLEGTVAKNALEQFEFTPSNATAAIPLHVTSSLVAEITPIVLFLSSSFDPDLWLIEEIESHLHPKIQLEVARFLVRLHNANKSIWLTTHSDSIMQKINNLITLSLRTDRKSLLNKLQFTEDDVFKNVDDIAVYQFESNDGATSIQKLPLTDYGFEIESFNHTLEKLILETAQIQEIGELDE